MELKIFICGFSTKVTRAFLASCDGEMKVSKIHRTCCTLWRVTWNYACIPFKCYKYNLDFDRNNLITHFCFSELLILEKKKVRGFFWGHWSIKKKCQKILKKHHTGELHKKGTILLQASHITLLFDSPCRNLGEKSLNHPIPLTLKLFVIINLS